MYFLGALLVGAENVVKGVVVELPSSNHKVCVKSTFSVPTYWFKSPRVWMVTSVRTLRTSK